MTTQKYRVMDAENPKRRSTVCWKGGLGQKKPVFTLGLGDRVSRHKVIGALASDRSGFQTQLSSLPAVGHWLDSSLLNSG